MNRTLRAIFGCLLIAVITFCGIAVFQSIGKSIRADITDQKLYTLSNGTKAILAKLHEPIKLKLYYARTAAMKGPDQIRFYNNYYYFVKALLDEYVREARGNIELQVIDPRPYSDEEADAIRNGVKKLPMSEDENFFFGLVAQTPFGVSKSIPFFAPDRQNFVEYDISYLIDNAVQRQKKRIGIMSSLPVMGDDVSGYMAQMMQMQGQEPKPPWTIVEQLRQQYDVTKVDTAAKEIKDVDMLLVIHPKNLSQETQFAIDQFVLKGGRTIVMLDPMCLSDRPNRQQMQYMQEPPNPSSDLPQLLKAWKLEMPENQVVGDRDIALVASMSQNANPGKIITYLGFNRQCFNPDNIIGANLNDVRFLFAGALKPIEDPNYKITLTPIVHTTAKGSTFQLTPYEMMMPEPEHLMSKYMEGMAPVNMGYLVTGKLRSAFPNGIEVAIDPNKPEDSNGVKADPNKPKPTKKTIKGLVQATNDCAVAVYSDVDFISDMLAYQHSFFGSAVVGDNAALLMNTVDDLCGSSDLIAIRSRGNFQRPFTVVDKIESDAEKATADEESKINAQIQGFQQDLNNIVSKAKEGDEQVIGNEVLKKKRQIEENLRAAQARLREVKAKRRENIEAMGNKLRNVNCAAAPAFILVIAIGLGIRRSFRRRHYISHASDS